MSKPSSLRRWTIGGPEVNRLLKEFSISEDLRDSDSAEINDVHHEQYTSFQRKFASNCSFIKESFICFENPFEIESDELISLDSRNVASKEAAQTLYELEERGLSLYRAFVEERLIKKTKSLFDPVNKVQCKIFALPVKKSGKNDTVSKLEEDVQLFSRMFIISTARDLDLSEFFRYENQLCPPSLSMNGSLRTGNKAHLISILEKISDTVSPPSVCDGVIFDGAALIHQTVPSKSVANMREYSEQILKPHLLRTAAKFKAQRIDVAWDLYLDASIKKAREARGVGHRQQDLPRKGACPTNWEKYLKNAQKKKELFKFLAEHLTKSFIQEHFVTNIGENFASSQEHSTGLINRSCSTMEEADGRMILHARDMIEHGAKSVLILCSDTDVLVLAISFYHSLETLGLSELWFLCGVGPNRRFIAVHLIAQKLGQDKAEALRGFHAFTGGDSVSFFSSRGKRTAWSVWTDDEYTSAFKSLGSPLDLDANGELDQTITKVLEKYVVSLYSGNQSYNGINDSRRVLFCSGDRPITAIPPTKGALEQHIKRAAYQAGQIWGKADQLHQTLTLPNGWGWVKHMDTWEPLWSSLPPIWAACRELDRCGCATNCETQRCCCRRYGIPCTPACKKCKGECCNKSSKTTAPKT